jgi:uncharacterized protein YbjT (DUF2867 family)
MNRTAIVIGATGVVGREVVKLLGDNPEVDQIVTFTRREFDFESPKVINYVIDFDNLSQYQDLVEGEYFFSCLGTTRALAGSLEKQRIVDFDYQFQFAQMAQKNGVHHYHLVSSPGADAKSSNGYLKMKGELEEATLKLDFASRCYYRPSLILGERADFRLGEKLGAVAGKFLTVLPGLAKYRPISGEQIAHKMIYESSRITYGTHYFELDEMFNIGE